jgi:hypothetical protein
MTVAGILQCMHSLRTQVVRCVLLVLHLPVAWHVPFTITQPQLYCTLLHLIYFRSITNIGSNSCCVLLSCCAAARTPGVRSS